MRQSLLVRAGTLEFFQRTNLTMSSIGIIQIGLKRNLKIAEKNHKKLYELLQSKYNINIYDFYRTGPIENCPFNSSGRIQLYDFFTSAEKINDDIILKIRSDIFLTDSSIEVLCKEIDKILNNELDICYLGLAFATHYDKVCHIERVTNKIKVPDFLVLARKNKLIEDWLDSIYKNTDDSMSGNVTYLKIKKYDAIAYMVSCQMYILRLETPEEDNWNLYYNSMDIERWRFKAPEAVEWVLNNKDIINKF